LTEPSNLKLPFQQICAVGKGSGAHYSITMDRGSHDFLLDAPDTLEGTLQLPRLQRGVYTIGVRGGFKAYQAPNSVEFTLKLEQITS